MPTGPGGHVENMKWGTEFSELAMPEHFDRADAFADALSRGDLFGALQNEQKHGFDFSEHNQFTVRALQERPEYAAVMRVLLPAAEAALRQRNEIGFELRSPNGAWVLHMTTTLDGSTVHVEIPLPSESLSDMRAQRQR